MISLNSLAPKFGSKHKKKRLGLGRGSGHGETCTRGQKGQKATSGGCKKPGFEGGQNPLFRRIPKTGFSNAQFATYSEWVNLSTLAKKFKANAAVTPEALKELGLVDCSCNVKILGEGTLEHPLTVSAHAFSKSAKEKIEKAGGKVIVLGAEKSKKA